MTKNKSKNEFIIRSAIKKYIAKKQAVTLNGQNVELPNLKTREDALELIMDRLNIYIEEQLINLKLSLPRFASGERKNEIKFKTIVSNHLISSEFPMIKKPSPNTFVDSMAEII
jgi:hypothetical protein